MYSGCYIFEVQFIPYRGVLYREDVKRHIWNEHKDEMGYEFIRKFNERPDPSEIMDAFAVIRKKREPALLVVSNAINGDTMEVPMPLIVSVATIVAAVGAHAAGIF